MEAVSGDEDLLFSQSHLYMSELGASQIKLLPFSHIFLQHTVENNDTFLVEGKSCTSSLYFPHENTR